MYSAHSASSSAADLPSRPALPYVSTSSCPKNPSGGVVQAAAPPGHRPHKAAPAHEADPSIPATLHSPDPCGRSGESLGQLGHRALEHRVGQKRVGTAEGTAPHRYHTVEQIDHGAQVRLPVRRLHLGDVRGPSHVERGHPEFPGEHAQRSLRYLAAAGAATYPLPDASGDQALLGRDPADHLLGGVRVPRHLPQSAHRTRW